MVKNKVMSYQTKTQMILKRVAIVALIVGVVFVAAYYFIPGVKDWTDAACAKVKGWFSKKK